MSYKIYVSVTSLFDYFLNFFCYILRLSLYKRSRKRNRLFFHVEKVRIYASLSFYKPRCLHSVIKDTICYRLKLHYISFISDYEKEDKFVYLFVRVFACTRVVDVVDAVRIVVPIILIFLRFNIYVL